MKKKIIFVNTNRAWGGGEKWHFQTAIELKNRDFEVVLVTNLRSALSIRAQANGLAFFSLYTHNLSFLNPFKILSLYFFFKGQRPSAVFLNLPADVKLAGMAAKLAGVPKIIYRRGMPHPLRNTWLNRFLFKKVLTNIIANSAEVKRSLLQGNEWLIKEKISLIPNGLSADFFKLSNENKSTLFTIGNLGRLVEQKGQIDLLELAEILLEDGLTFQILLAGEGEDRKMLEEEIRKRDLKEVVKLVGHVEDISSFFKIIDLFVFPSRFEGFSNALIEAMGASIPVIAYDIPPNREAMGEEATQCLVPLGNIEELAMRIKEIYFDEKKRTEVARKNKDYVQMNFGQDVILEKILQILK